MARLARKQSESGIYHVMLRGINRQVIFEDEQDSAKFTQQLEQYHGDGLYSLYAYCLMSNHVHLLIRERKETLDQIMKRLGVSYAMYYNTKYQRSGHLFQDRFKSQPVESDEYLIQVLRYIHQNPVQADLCRNAADYPYSSYCCYDDRKRRQKNIPRFIDTEEVWQLIDKTELIAYMQEENEDRLMDLEEPKHRLTDEEAVAIYRTLTGGNSPAELQNAAREYRDYVIGEMNDAGVPMRQIERITGLSHGVVQRACER